MHITTHKQEGNTFWFFGCSFTAGYPLNWEWAGNKGEGELYRLFKDGYADTIYPKLFAKHFNLDYRNYATPGASNQTTLVKLSNCLQLMKPGDKVWVNSTWPGRLPVPSLVKKQVVDVLMMTIEDRSLSIKDWGDTGNELITTYLAEIIGPGSDVVFQHYRTALFDITTHLNSIGIKSFLWDAPDYGHDYELICDWRNDCDDRHLSPNGHKKIFEDNLKNFE